MNAYVASVIDYVKKTHANEPEFVQTVEEVLSSVSPIMDAHPEYEKVDLLIFGMRIHDRRNGRKDFLNGLNEFRLVGVRLLHIIDDTGYISIHDIFPPKLICKFYQFSQIGTIIITLFS